MKIHAKTRKTWEHKVQKQAWLTSKRFSNSFSGNIFVYLSIGIYIKFFGNIKTFSCSNNPVQEIANSQCDLQYCVRWLCGLCVMLSAAMCHCPAVAAWCGGLWLDVGGGEGSGERESLGQLCEFHLVTTGGSVYSWDEIFNCLCLH